MITIAACLSTASLVMGWFFWQRENYALCATLGMAGTGMLVILAVGLASI